MLHCLSVTELCMASSKQLYMLNLGEKVANEIFKKTGNKKVKILYFDFRNLRSVKRCSDEIKKITTKIDILVNNAGKAYIIQYL